MRISTLVLVVALASLQPSGQYQITKTYNVGGDGSWDYIVPDPPNHRLFIGRQNRVMVVDGEEVTSDLSSLDKAGVTVEVLGATKGPKIVIQKYKNKTGYRKRQGHRQKYTQVKVTDISL